MTHRARQAQDTLASTIEFDLIFNSPTMTAGEKLNHLRQVLVLRLRIEAEIWPALVSSPIYASALQYR